MPKGRELGATSVLDIEKERLKDAPGFDKDHWPSMADRTWASEIYSYYNRRPYWQ